MKDLTVEEIREIEEVLEFDDFLNEQFGDKYPEFFED